MDVDVDVDAPTVADKTGRDRAVTLLAAARLGLLVAVASSLAIAYRLGMFAHVADPRSLAQQLVAMGAYGYVAYVLAYAALQPFGVPGTVFVIAAPLIWPWETAFALSMTGTMAASVIGFSFARFIARDWIASRIPKRLRRYDEALETHAFRTVFFLRLVLWMPQVLHSFLGVSKVPFSTHFWASLLGYAGPLFMMSYLGAEMFDVDGGIRPSAWPIMGAMLAFSLVIAVGARWYGARLPATSN